MTELGGQMKTRTLARLSMLLPVLMVFSAVVVAAPSIACAAGSWTAQRSGTTNYLTSVKFIDATHGWTVGYGGVIVATTDGGAHWTVQPSGTASTLNAVTFVDVTHGWAVGEERTGPAATLGGVILATTDGGSHWTTQTAGGTSSLSSVSFTDANHGWAVGEEQDEVTGDSTGTILATTDGGSHWTTQAVGSGVYLNSVSFTDANHGWAVGAVNGQSAAGLILATTDGGSHWTTQTTGVASWFSSVTSVDASHAWVVGQDPNAVISTTDGGALWASETLPAIPSLLSVDFTDAAHGWAVARNGDGDQVNGNILSTIDGGVHWTSTAHDGLAGIDFVDPTHGWAVGDNGQILTYRPVITTTTRLKAPSSAKKGKTLKLTGTVSPTTASGKVKIYLYRLVGRSWKSAGSTTVTAARGSFTYSFKPNYKGTWRFRADYLGAAPTYSTSWSSYSNSTAVR